MMSGDDLLQAVADGRAVEGAHRYAFARMLLTLRDEMPRHLTFDQQQLPNIRPPEPQEPTYLQSLWHFQLTPSGRDRACARVILEGLPDPDQDDSRSIPALFLDYIALARSALLSHMGQEATTRRVVEDDATR